MQKTNYFLSSSKERKEKSNGFDAGFDRQARQSSSVVANTKRDEKINTLWNLNEIGMNGILLNQHFSALGIQKMISKFICNENAIMWILSYSYRQKSISPKWYEKLSNYHTAIFDSDHVCVETIDRPSVSARRSTKASAFRDIQCLID